MQKTVEVRDRFVVKKENTKTNSPGIQSNNIQETKKKRKVKEKDTMPTVHYVNRGFLKKQGIKCVNGVFDFKMTTIKKPKRRGVEVPWSMGRKRGAENPNDYGRQQKPMETNPRNAEEQLDALNENKHSTKESPMEIKRWKVEEQFGATSENDQRMNVEEQFGVTNVNSKAKQTGIARKEKNPIPREQSQKCYE